MISRNLREHVYRLAGDIGERNLSHPAALSASADYIAATWSAQRYEVREQAYRVFDVECANLEVERPGISRPSAIILLGAHYDTVLGSPGANDNGSAVATLLELSRLFATAETEVTFRFVAFVNEEAPYFYTEQQGSQVYAKAARQRGDDIRLMISLETMGYYRDERGSQGYPPLFRYFFPDRGNFIALVSNLRSRRVLRKLARAFRQSSDFPIEYAATFAFVPGVAWSDHLSFWRNGYKALMVTDTAFYRYPWYHMPEDTPEKLDYERLAQVTEGLYHALLRVARS